MTLVDAFQLLPLGILGVKIAPGSTQCLLRSTDGPLKPTKYHLSIDRGFSQAERGPILTEEWHCQTCTWTSQANTKPFHANTRPSRADGAPSWAEAGPS